MQNNTEVKLAVLEERSKHITEQIDSLSGKIEHIEQQLSTIQQQADRWKMGFVVIAGLGGVIGWILTSAETILKLFKR